MGDFRGSGSLRQIPDVMLGLERNMRNLNYKDKTLIRVIKNRWFAETGLADSLYYIENTGRLQTLNQEFEDD